MENDALKTEWKMIVHRASGKLRNPIYKSCTLHPDFADFDKYCSWRAQAPFAGAADDNGKKYQIDKDILVPKNKQYGPNTCPFVPPIVNAYFASISNRDYHTIGTSTQKWKKGYWASIMLENKLTHLGCYATLQEANAKYIEAKIRWGQELAKRYAGRLDERVICILSNVDLKQYML